LSKPRKVVSGCARCRGKSLWKKLLHVESPETLPHTHAKVIKTLHLNRILIFIFIFLPLDVPKKMGLSEFGSCMRRAATIRCAHFRHAQGLGACVCLAVFRIAASTSDAPAAFSPVSISPLSGLQFPRQYALRAGGPRGRGRAGGRRGTIESYMALRLPRNFVSRVYPRFRSMPQICMRTIDQQSDNSGVYRAFALSPSCDILDDFIFRHVPLPIVVRCSSLSPCTQKVIVHRISRAPFALSDKRCDSDNLRFLFVASWHVRKMH
jgi:hypothetical protein